MRNATPDRIYARRWATLAVLCLSLLVVVVDNTVVNVALPTLVRHLHASTTSLQWVVDAYTLALAGLLLTLGSLGDRIGRHRLLAGGLVVFGVGSALAAVSGSADRLIFFRALMGVGAAAIMPATLSILTNVFTDPKERPRAIALWSAVSGLGVAIGPTLGGWLLEHFNWGSIFLINVPIVVVALVAGRFVIPPSADENPPAIDPVGALLSIAGLVSLVYAIIDAPNHGWLSARTDGLALAGLALTAGWVVWELRSSHPMVDLRIFRNARFSAASIAVTLIFFSLFGWLFLFTQQLQFVLGYNTLQAGVRALPFALMIGAVSPAAAQLALRLGTKLVVASGLLLMAAGFGMMATSTVHTGYNFLLVASLVIATGMGLAMSPATESIMGSLPAAQAGVGSAVNDTTRELGGALGVAIMGSIGSSIFVQRFHSVLVHVPAALAAPARSSVGAAVTLGQRTQATMGPALVHGARHAFMTGADYAVLVAAGAALLGAVVAIRFLPARVAEAGEAESAVSLTRPAALPELATV
jgi:EmrB/QacA subfamily drug resistance transporter